MGTAIMLSEKDKSVLDFLFKSYKENSNKVYDITPIAGKDSLMIANKLLQAALIKDEIQSNGTYVKASISIDGIRAVDPKFIEAKSRELISLTGPPGTIWNAVTLMKASEKDYQFCFDLANDIYNQDYVKLLYALYPGKVMIEPTLKKFKI